MEKYLLFGMIIIVFATIISSIGTLSLKLSSSYLHRKIFLIFKSPVFYLSLFCHSLSAIIYVYALRFGDLSALYPIGGLNYIWVSLLSIKYLKEKMDYYKWVGIILIIIAVVFIGLGS